MSISNKPKGDNIIEMNCGGQHHRIPTHKITYIESDDRRIAVHTTDNKIVCYHRIRDIELLLGASFYRCHRSYVVNLKYIMEYSNCIICLENGAKIPLSRRKYTEFKKVLSLYNET